MRAPAQIFPAAKFTPPYRTDVGRSKPRDFQLLKIEPRVDTLWTNDELHLSEVALELSRMAVTAEDLHALRLTEAELAGMAPTMEEVLAMTDDDWVRLRLSPAVLTLLREDLMRRLGVSAQDLTWLRRAIERGQHGHTRAQTGAD